MSAQTPAEQWEACARSKQRQLDACDAILTDLGIPAGRMDTTNAYRHELVAVFTLDARLRTLADEVRRLREDAARLDWYDQNAGPLWVVKYTRPDGSVQWSVNNVKYPDIRAAIDAARASLPTEG